MPLISVITAAHWSTADYIEEAMESLRGQVLPPGWNLEWIVQEDGANPSLGDKLRRWDAVSYAANGRQLGIAFTWNLALSRAAGVLTQTLDADDLLLPGALAALIPLFAADPSSGQSARPRTDAGRYPEGLQDAAAVRRALCGQGEQVGRRRRG